MAVGVLAGRRISAGDSNHLIFAAPERQGRELDRLRRESAQLVEHSAEVDAGSDFLRDRSSQAIHGLDGRGQTCLRVMEAFEPGGLVRKPCFLLAQLTNSYLEPEGVQGDDRKRSGDAGPQPASKPPCVPALGDLLRLEIHLHEEPPIRHGQVAFAAGRRRRIVLVCRIARIERDRQR